MQDEIKNFNENSIQQQVDKKYMKIERKDTYEDEDEDEEKEILKKNSLRFKEVLKRNTIVS